MAQNREPKGRETYSSQRLTAAQRWRRQTGEAARDGRGYAQRPAPTCSPVGGTPAHAPVLPSRWHARARSRARRKVHMRTAVRGTPPLAPADGGRLARARPAAARPHTQPGMQHVPARSPARDTSAKARRLPVRPHIQLNRRYVPHCGARCAMVVVTTMTGGGGGWRAQPSGSCQSAVVALPSGGSVHLDGGLSHRDSGPVDVNRSATKIGRSTPLDILRTEWT